MEDEKDHSRFPSVYPARTGGYEKSASGLVGGDANTIFKWKAAFESCMPPCLCLCYSNSGSKCQNVPYRGVSDSRSRGIVPAVLAAVAEEENSTFEMMDPRVIYKAEPRADYCGECFDFRGSWHVV